MVLRTRLHRLYRGFTLLELSVVLAIIGVVLAGGTLVLTASVQTAQYNATIDRIKALDTALLNYRVSFNRLPCPADLTLPPANVNYGEEAGWNSSSTIQTATGFCTGTGMVPQANFSAAASATADTVAEGAVPTRALRLPDSYMFDAWGRRFRYAVDVTLTAANAFTNTPILPSICSPAGISVTDASDVAGSRTVNGIYAIVSHGANGHGGYTTNGVAFSAASVNADEQTNCHCNSSAAAGTYAPTYVQKLLTTDPANSSDNFDDLVSFKTLDQLQTATTTEAAGQCPYFAVSYNNGSVGDSLLYIWNHGQLIQLASAAVGQTGGSYLNGTAIAFSFDNNFLYTTPNDTQSVYSHGANWGAVVYAVSSSGLSWASDIGSTYYAYNILAVSKTTYNIAYGLYQYGSLNAWSGPSPYGGATATLNPGPNSFMDYAPNNNIYIPISTMAIYSSPALSLLFNYDITSAVGTAGFVLPVSVHPSGNYVALGAAYVNATATGSGGAVQSVTQGTTPVVIKNPEGNYSYISNGQVNVSDGEGSIKWSPDGNYLALGGANHTALRIYAFSSVVPETFTSIYYDGKCGTNVNGLAWSSDSVYLSSVTNTGTCFYKRSGVGASALFSNFTPTGATLPSGVQGTAFSH